ncbi:cytochrome c biogenesis heme-transporting ATPase CcmA [Halieaceae bacterium IMCC14734]|uniref:Cytochrome c biogenesis heme-transporting ATPase CcmA n=1 Tax=Candidatus Litorirhabdus singularis TaxID=2518993 RepID=A0ABT3TJC1_9GAMM|nr:cytochrome c biogenesis heme-transporting ATPase CcmA [Candidatus Litorirhabdus singularis]MCX2981509.1 cytochrome c biogenesis heme-transporting ATPase CcmA [Candidatus Litorirhabdus singularis]
MTAAAHAEPLLKVHGLELERGGRVLLSDFSLEIYPGEVMMLEGENGSGKTSLLRTLAGLARYGYSGGLQCNADSLLYLGHKAGVKTLLTPRENLRWYCSVQNLPLAGLDAALQSVELTGYEDIPCHNLSAGQQRRVNLARLYLSEAPLWLLDEPFTAIDRAGVKRLADVIAARAAAGGAVVLTSHQPLPSDYPVRRVSIARQERS